MPLMVDRQAVILEDSYASAVTPDEAQKVINDSSDAIEINKEKICWMRQINVILTSRKVRRSMSFNNFDPRSQFTMDLAGQKKVSLNEDKGTFTIYNLEYDKISEILINEYFTIEIQAGYQSMGTLPTIFKGEISYISQKIHSAHDTETYFCYASTLVARYSQSRINFNLNSSINIYSALNYVCKLSGIRSENYRISPELKKELLQNIYNNYGTCATVFDNLTSTSGNYDLSVDSSDGLLIDVTTINEKRKIKIDPNIINITSGNPTVTSAGLQMSVLPVMNFKPGDILILDNSLINVSIKDAESVKDTFNTNYLDQNGMYMIIEIHYHLQNRGSAFDFDIQARALDIIKKMQVNGQYKVN